MMTIKLACVEYGFECDFVLEGKKSLTLIQKLRDHMESEHSIDYTVDAVIQMIVNKGHARSSIRNE
jgi:predicted small metal-binding protein